MAPAPKLKTKYGTTFYLFKSVVSIGDLYEIKTVASIYFLFIRQTHIFVD